MYIDLIIDYNYTHKGTKPYAHIVYFMIPMAEVVNSFRFDVASILIL